jgi:hypothetical protein
MIREQVGMEQGTFREPLTRIFHGRIPFSLTPRLQPGVVWPVDDENCFNSLSAGLKAVETAETRF